MARYEGQSALGKLNHRRRHQRLVNAFADNLADGFSVKDAASMVGQKPSWGNNTLAHIKRGLGWQAQ